MPEPWLSDYLALAIWTMMTTGPGLSLRIMSGSVVLLVSVVCVATKGHKDTQGLGHVDTQVWYCYWGYENLRDLYFQEGPWCILSPSCY